MSNPTANASRDVRINVEYGLHMRPVELFTQTALKYVSEIMVLHISKGELVSGKSLLDLLTLAAECGTVLRIQAQGPDAEEAVEALARLVESDFRDDKAARASGQAE